MASHNNPHGAKRSAETQLEVQGAPPTRTTPSAHIERERELLKKHHRTCAIKVGNAVDTLAAILFKLQESHPLDEEQQEEVPVRENVRNLIDEIKRTQEVYKGCVPHEIEHFCNSFSWTWCSDNAQRATIIRWLFALLYVLQDLIPLIPWVEDKKHLKMRADQAVTSAFCLDLPPFQVRESKAWPKARAWTVGDALSALEERDKAYRFVSFAFPQKK